VNKFGEEMEHLKNRLLQMSSLVKAGIERSVYAVVKKDRRAAEEVFENESRINAIELEIDGLGINLLAIHQQSTETPASAPPSSSCWPRPPKILSDGAMLERRHTEAGCGNRLTSVKPRVLIAKSCKRWLQNMLRPLIFQQHPVFSQHLGRHANGVT
jgi:hypothetical protein